MLTRTAGTAVRLAVAFTVLVVLIACGGGNQPPARGSLAGTVVVGSQSAGVPLNARPSAGSRLDAAVVASDADTLDFVPGELIVGYRQVASSDVVGSFTAPAVLDLGGVRLHLVRSTPVLASGLYRAAGLSKVETLALALELAGRPEVAYAEPNYIFQPLAVPNDPLYGRQWHYDRIDMESAWDITTGSSSVVVAVLDSGILYRSSDDTKQHPDFEDRIVPGYDFITDADFAMDGDGRDADPFDSVSFEGYHGSHVAGTIGAATDNGLGVSGVDWQAKILPVRVLGDGGGTLADIRDGLVWAAGYGVPGVPVNTNAADVVNMSLGGSSVCSAGWQSAIDFVSEDVIVVVAAGNANVNASSFSPAGCAGVITVGSTDRADERSWFSNYGSRIDVMAPGGDLDEDLDSDGFPDGVFSTGFNDNSGTFTYTNQQGTSMAAPHVAGIIALMKSIRPDLDSETALAALRASATPLDDAACDGFGASRTLTSIDCGAGLIDAFKAITYIDQGEIPDPVGATLRFTPTALEFGASTTRMDFQLTNISDDTLDWELNFYQEAGDNPGEMLEGAFVIPDDSPNSGTLAPGASVSTAIVIDRSQLSAAGNYQIHLVFEIDGGVDEELLLMRFTKISVTKPSLSGPMLVAAYVEDEFGDLITSGFQSSDNVINNFDFDVAAGPNLLAGWSDKNDNGTIDTGDLFGYYDKVITVGPGQRLTGLILRLDPVFSSSNLPAALSEQLERSARSPDSTLQ
ncbi:MAG TPA: S8 family peptidase [Trueperaceae bacterium]|nr:S8 family peptidase [Trueperaceae bacterium]